MFYVFLLQILDKNLVSTKMKTCKKLTFAITKTDWKCVFLVLALHATLLCLSPFEKQSNHGISRFRTLATDDLEVLC